MKRLLLTTAAAAGLLALPALAHAQSSDAPAKPAKPMAHHRATGKTMARSGRSPYRYTGYHGGDTAAGNAAVDQLNAQSLAAARGQGAAPGAMAPAPAAPAMSQ